MHKTMKIMRMNTALQVNNAAHKRLGSSWSSQAAEPKPTAVGQEAIAWDTYREDLRIKEAHEVLAWLNTL